MTQVFYKGDKMNKMMADLEKFRQEIIRAENSLQEYQGNYRIIYLKGRKFYFVT